MGVRRRDRPAGSLLATSLYLRPVAPGRGAQPNSAQVRVSAGTKPSKAKPPLSWISLGVLGEYRNPMRLTACVFQSYQEPPQRCLTLRTRGYLGRAL